MKILFDPVYTAPPSKCSTSYLVWSLIEDLSAQRKDLFFYVLYPSKYKDDPVEQAFLSRLPDRVRLLPMAQTPGCRLSELFTVSTELRHYLSPWSAETWDADVVVSSRIPMLSAMRVHCSRATSTLAEMSYYSRMIVGLEEMPILSHRSTVPWSKLMYPNQLMAYALADAVLVAHQWMRRGLKSDMRNALSPAFQKQVLDKLYECLPERLERLSLKASPYQEGPFRVATVGRAGPSSDFPLSAELMAKHFSYPLGKNKQQMEFVVTTNSGAVSGIKISELEFADIQYNSREKFFDLLGTLDLALTMTPAEDFSMTVYETLKHGVPLILKTAEWNEFLGPDYPFRVSTMVEAYAMINYVAGNYAEAYAKFVAWEGSHWRKFVEGPSNLSASDALLALVHKYWQKIIEDIKGCGGVYRDRLAALPESSGPLDLVPVVENPLITLEGEDPSQLMLISRYPNPLVLKRTAASLGYLDTNTCGVMTKGDHVSD